MNLKLNDEVEWAYMGDFESFRGNQTPALYCKGIVKKIARRFIEVGLTNETKTFTIEFLEKIDE